MKLRRMALIAALAAWLAVASSGTAMGHPGNTDAAGGHTCYTNCPSWGLSYGQYHFHGSSGSSSGGGGGLGGPSVGGGGFGGGGLGFGRRYRLRQLEKRLERAQTDVSAASAGLAEAESAASSAAASMSGVEPELTAAREAANEGLRAASRARARADAAEERMVERRLSAAAAVNALEASYASDLDDWRAERVGLWTLACVSALLALAFLALPLARRALRNRRVSGLSAATYAIVVTSFAVLTGVAVGLGLLVAGYLTNSWAAALSGPVAFLAVLLFAVALWFAASPASQQASRSRMLAGVGALSGLVLVAGILLAVAGLNSPTEPEIPARQQTLSVLAKPEPSANPTRRVARLARRADVLEAEADAQSDGVRQVEASYRRLERSMARRQRAASDWAGDVARAEERVANLEARIAALE